MKYGVFIMDIKQDKQALYYYQLNISDITELFLYKDNRTRMTRIARISTDKKPPSKCPPWQGGRGSYFNKTIFFTSRNSPARKM